MARFNETVPVPAMLFPFKVMSNISICTITLTWLQNYSRYKPYKFISHCIARVNFRSISLRNLVFRYKGSHLFIIGFQILHVKINFKSYVKSVILNYLNYFQVCQKNINWCKHFLIKNCLFPIFIIYTAIIKCCSSDIFDCATITSSS